MRRRLTRSCTVLAMVLAAMSLPVACARPSSGKSTDDQAMAIKAGYDDTRDPARDLSALVIEAQARHKRILLVVGGEWCIWCHYLHNFLDKETDIRTAWDGAFLTLHVNYSPENKNEAFLSQYPKIPGYPHIFVLDEHGMLLQSQDTSDLESGRGYSKAAVKAFIDRWKS